MLQALMMLTEEINSNESLANKKIKNEIEQLLSKYKQAKQYS